MIIRSALSRQILLSMAALTLIVIMLFAFGLYIGYALILTFYPSLAENDSLVPSNTDLLLLFVIAFLALLVAGFVSLKLAARILVPINSLAESARRIAAGDLTARAIPGDHSLGETSQLVSDFNLMAQRLQDMADDVTYWNAAIAHELRTPLTIMKGKLQGVDDGVFVIDEKLVASLRVQTDGLARLVDDLRVLTLASAGHLDLRLESFSLSSEVKSIADTMESSLTDAGFSLSLHLADITITADKNRLYQILVSLLNNAQKYANPGYLEISTYTLGNQAVLKVQDSGPGLPSNFLKRAFAPFTRADDSRSRKLGGSGLGLSVVKVIAEAHGGRANCYNAAKGGAVFEITFPL